MPFFLVGEILVVIFLLLLVTYWGNQLFRYRVDLEKESEVLEKLQEVSALEETIEPAIQGKDGGPLRDEAFLEFCDGKKVSSSSDVARHLRAIYESGCTDAPIRVAELNNHTCKSLFHRGGMLQSLLGIFIVIGLLGTLLGLGNGLSELTGLYSDEPNRDEIFKSFLDATRHAFIPSGLGIFFTLVGVFLYAFFVKSTCHPLAKELERITRDVWVPRFERTPAAGAVQNLADAQRQLDKHAEVMGRVAEFAKSVDQELSEFAPNIETANNTVESFNESIKLVEESSKIFGQTISQISEFEKFLKAMHETTDQNTADVREFFKQLKDQNELIDKHLRNLQTFEVSYTEGQKETQRTNKELSTAAQDAFGALKRRNEEIIAAVGKPISDRLGQIENSLRNMRDPLYESAGKIEGISDNFAKHSKTIMLELNEHYFKQFQNFKKDQDEQSKVLKSLDKSTSALLLYLKNQQSLEKQEEGQVGGMSERLLFLFLGASLIAALGSVYITWVR